MTHSSRLGSSPAGTAASDGSPAPVGPSGEPSVEMFEAFMMTDGVRLRRVLYAHFGMELGPEAMADATAYAWEHWTRVEPMANRIGYLYRVAQSAMRRQYRWQRPDPVLPTVDPSTAVDAIVPELAGALAKLSPPQRTAVVLVHSLGWTLAETATSMNVTVSTVRNHLRRGLTHLRRDLGGTDD